MDGNSLNPTKTATINRTECVGSATGNPRNKCALKPGHSLLDWIRLTNSGEDLTGQRGRILPVTLDELAKHKHRNDAWLAIHGQVYNVTRYMDFHPGGVDELMRGVGKDATKLFGEVHAWVNYQQLLHKCRIGPLKATNAVHHSAISLHESLSTKAPEAVLDSSEFSPRSDWIQTTNRLNLFIYTKRLCNPGFIIRKLNHEPNWKLDIWILMDSSIYKYQCEFHDHLIWPINHIKVIREAGKLEVSFNKAIKANYLWPSLGALKLTHTDLAYNASFSMDFHIITNQEFNHDSYHTILGNMDVYLIPPICSHITISLKNGISRHYTPVPEFYVPGFASSENIAIGEQRKRLDSHSLLNLLWKNYDSPDSFTQYLRNLKTNEIVQISMPMADIRLNLLLKHRRFCLIAAGSGITPMLSLIGYLLERQSNRVDHLYLLYFNKTFKDIWCLNKFKKLREDDERFHVIPILTRANNADENVEDICNDISLFAQTQEFRIVNGELSGELLSPLFRKTSSEHVTFTAICGPKSFNRKTQTILEDLQFSSADIYVFQ